MATSLRRRVGEQRDIAGSLDCTSQITLLLGVQTVDTTGRYLATVGDEVPKLLGIFVIELEVRGERVARWLLTPTTSASSTFNVEILLDIVGHGSALLALLVFGRSFG
jgi:hypothetical protein